MYGTRSSADVTNLDGDIDRNGDVVGVAIGVSGPLDLRYRERPGLDERLQSAAADVAAVRRMLGVSS